MPTIAVPSLMKYYVNDLSEIPVTGTTVQQALNDLTLKYPAIKTHILDSRGNIRRYVNLFVNQNNITDLEGLDTPIQETDKIILMPSISGG